jgi:RNA polymerase sigma factor (sigma-70 family)
MSEGSSSELEGSDYELVKRCLSGENEVFTEIFTRYKGLVYRTIFNFMPGSPDVADLFQEVFLRIYRSLPTYNPEYQFSTWTVRIARNLCLDRLRQKGPDHETVEDIEEFSDDRESAEEHCIAREQTERVRKALHELPEEYRTPVILFHQQGLSYEAIAQVLGEPMTIVKNRLYRARLMLRQMLSSNGKGR